MDLFKNKTKYVMYETFDYLSDEMWLLLPGC